jgi:ankyrin repeat protein
MGSLRNIKTDAYLDSQQIILNKKKKELDKILIDACRRDDPVLVLDAIRQGADVNFMDKDDKMSIFSWCIEGNSQNVLHTLISHGLDLSLKDPQGDTPLHSAAAMARYGIVNRLIKMGADLTIKDRDGLTPLGVVLDNLSRHFDMKDESDIRIHKEYELTKRILQRAEEKNKKENAR